ncbi:hypothetical protein AB0K48_48275 [Nonomuraea sp. NPDC055795]
MLFNRRLPPRTAGSGQDGLFWTAVAAAAAIGAVAGLAAAGATSRSRPVRPPESPDDQPPGLPAPPAQDGKEGRRSGLLPLALALGLTFAVWPITEEILEAYDEAFRTNAEPYLPWVDLALIIVIVAIPWSSRPHGWKIKPVWVLPAAVISVGLGLLPASQEEGGPVGFDVAIALGYLIAQIFIVAALVGVRPAPRGRKRATDDPQAAKAGWRRFRSTLPLLIGTGAMYFASIVWGGYIEKVDQQYFAQMSQVLPLLLIALGLEAKFFNELAPGIAGRATTMVIVVTLCIGELFAISGTVTALAGWIGYMAFLVTANACGIALVSLVWALALREPVPGGRSAAGPARPPG